MTRTKKKELADLVDPFESAYTCWLHRPERVEIEDGRIWVEYSGLEGVVPLEHGDLFMKFAGFARRKDFSEKRTENHILRWVSRFGLPARGLEWKRGAPINPAVVSEDNPENTSDLHRAIRDHVLKTSRPAGHSMSVEDFENEVQFAYGLRGVYLEIQGRDAAAIQARIKGLQPAHGLALSGTVEDMVRRGFEDAFWRSCEADPNYLKLKAEQCGSKEDQLTLLMAQSALGEIITRLVGGVRLRAGMQREQGLTPSYECPDLLTALYLQCFLLITGSKPIRYCENCGQPFELTRPDKKTCDASCRSAASKKRRKSRHHLHRAET